MIVKTSVWIINWILTRIYLVAPFVSNTIHTFPRTNSSSRTKLQKSREEPRSSKFYGHQSHRARSSGDNDLTKLLSHSCPALWCLSISCWETISWKVNLALKDNMLLKSDKKEKLSKVQTDCLCSQVPKENVLPEIFSEALSAATFLSNSAEIKCFSLQGNVCVGGVFMCAGLCVCLCVTSWIFLIRIQQETW